MANLARQKASGIAQGIGKAAAHAASPNDFEYYACTFELIDNLFNVEDIFHFPVMPNGINIGRNSLVSIKKTGTGYLSQFSDSFVGRNITLNGTFGRKFRLMISTSKGRNISTRKGGNFDLKFKTGYGALKLMEKIIEKSFEVNDGKPRLLLFHNLTFNQSFVVEVTNFQVSQSLENNMMWNYNLEMKALANVNNLKLESTQAGRLVDLLAAELLTDVANDLFGEIDFDELLVQPGSLI